MGSQVECVDRFLSWFAFHLSNFDFKWLWAEWAAAAKQVFFFITPKPRVE